MRKYFATICQIWFGVFVKDGEAFVISILRNLVEWVRSKGNLVEWPRFKGDFSRKTLSLPAVFAVDPTPTPTATANPTPDGEDVVRFIIEHQIDMRVVLVFVITCFIIYFLWKWKGPKNPPTDSGNQAFFSLLALFTIAEDPITYNLSPYSNYLKIVGFGFILMCIIAFCLKDRIVKLYMTLFYILLKYRLPRTVICYYCYVIMHIRGYAELHFVPYSVFFGLPQVAFFVNWILEFSPFFANWFLLMLIWFSIGITFLSWDQIGINVSKILEEPTHPFTNAYKAFETTKLPLAPFYHAGFGTIKKLTAAGQAAILAGVTTAIGGIGVAALNVWGNDRRDQRAAEQANQHREEQAREAQRNRDAQATEAQRNREEQAREAQRNRDAQATEAQRIREAKRESKANKYAEAHAQREHEKAHWAQDALQNEKRRQEELDKAKKKWPWG